MKKKIKFILNKEPLNRAGYTVRGEYFGVGQPLYWYNANDKVHPEIEINGWLRALNREEAREKLKVMLEHRKIEPTFYN